MSHESHEHILKVLRSDVEEDEYVLVNVQSDGPKPLDLKLVATDGDAPYISTIKHSKISKLQIKNSPITDSEWELVLTSALGLREDGESVLQAKSFPKIEVAASITMPRLALVFRRNISGVTQRLGEISLQLDENQEIALFEWTATAADKASNLETALRDLDVKYQDQSKISQKLREQLDDLIEAKTEHEKRLLEKFQALLNAKKLKIRDQQRLLATAKVDSRKAAQIRDARRSQAPRRPESSRAAKRKANEQSQADTAMDGEDKSGFEQMPAKGEGLDSGQETPSRSDPDITEDEDGDDRKSISPVRSPSGKGKLMESPQAQTPLS